MGKFILYFIITLLLVGCGSVQSSNPPNLTLEIGGETYQTEQGTYCWANKCVDMVSPEEILKGKGTIKVSANEEIKLVINYKPNQIESHLTNFKDGVQSDIQMKGLRFNAPSEPGVYYYDASFWWMDPKQSNTSEGDSSYVFAIEVQ